MKIENKIDIPFGIAGVISGYVLLAFGLVVLLFTASGIGFVVALIGGILAFTTTGAIIDIQREKVMFYDKILGIYKKGNWQDLSLFSSIKVKKTNEEQKVYLMANKALKYKYKNYEVIMCSKDCKIETLVMKYEFKETANIRAEKLCKLINDKTKHNFVFIKL